MSFRSYKNYSNNEFRSQVLNGMAKFHKSDIKVELFPFLGFFKEKANGCALKASKSYP